ncbi:sensor domain-containing diguanylate cyclase [Paraburkholderia silvatlantica]|uniref:diguanylate cyclase n=1 Tax=Paraburkholderia silvatlantica TaxID=321895 RepID=A0A2U1A8D9_9BURK|nr:sensor domain-containing diguanylate cyclase [Paraburkholderia silvatlantica]MBB2929017.1 diguanylate cyclase (GGDEF)-like protein [Paraburkholderia silvatlantica]PVY29113.1 diguanylate cyclase (GGDEF)-like protein [Paraburkholderia silvatlantica]PXW36588.1 diguanylate cyclase (GGDEF)-like protein [Paraburkholderia silvatlantica]PYE22071.1 diguanylate cyclase (GGDEF)-like protein [Paraburkholderia silvatlantica]TDQ98976.1 diguanylate cyclase (GGDEF)-like protein [Paraburkholderia silvatlant
MALTKFAGAFLARPTLFIVGAAAAAIALASVVALALYDMRLDAFARARDAADNISLILQRDIERNIEVYELSLEAVIDGVGDPAVEQLPPQIRQRVLFDRLTDAKDMGSLLVTNSAGDVVIDSRSVPPRRVNVRDRDYFTIQQQSADAGLYISKPFSPRITKPETSIGLSRRLTDGRGQFAGIVVGTLRLNYFHRLFEGTTLGDHGSITLVRPDGTVLMRRPYNQREVGQSIAGPPSFNPLIQADRGSYVGTATLDGAKRLYSFRHVGKYPLIVVVGLATEDIYAEWKRRAWAIGGVVAALDFLIIAMSVMVSWQLRKRLEMEQQLHRLANTDSLTGVGTRRVLDSALDAEWRRASRNKQSLSLLMVDVDNFKSFNDNYGHSTGDRALRTIARCIAENICRPGDFVGRYGGEEFCVLLPNTELPDARQVAEKIRSAVFMTDPANFGSRCRRLSVSIGVAVFDGNARPGDAPDRLVDMADQRLYEAKAAGRNTVMPQQEHSAVERDVALLDNVGVGLR